MPDHNSRSAKIDELRGRLEKQPGSRLFLELARELHEAGELEHAAQVCAEGVAHHPAYLSARVLLGRIHRDMGNLDEARTVLEAVLERAPDNLLARRLLAEICREQGDLEGALERFKALLAFSSEDEETRSAIEAIEAQQAGDDAGPAVEESRKDVKKVEVPPVDPEGAHLATPTLAEIFLQQGLTGKAAEVYREILHGDPGNEEAKARLEQIETHTVSAAPAPPEPPADPAVEARHRAIEALQGWLRAVQKGSRLLA